MTRAAGVANSSMVVRVGHHPTANQQPDDRKLPPFSILRSRSAPVLSRAAKMVVKTGTSQGRVAIEDPWPTGRSFSRWRPKLAGGQHVSKKQKVCFLVDSFTLQFGSSARHRLR